MRTSRLEQIIGRAAHRVDLNQRVSARILRNTAATWLKQAGASPSLIAAYLGEADSLTDDYADGTSEDVRAAVQRLADRTINDRELTIARSDGVRLARADWPFGPRAGQ
jgi:integrase